ncbi:class I SAM-dependent methyltransferase [Natronobacterium texcoconense]|uniref:Methyltransferase domain-containing protein n=1 Tax=Natronobacterium texcoconense TaxID=1095778 RepID=A0A1H1BT97_NATTX|nr:class I SAM-dependent methyltransferase [Natronobacterium texcoconense]SDQ55127.1 hypothetical protein SAMN04489842_1145 [Natronobacterium texcoconense]
MTRTDSKERYLAAKRTVDDRALDRAVLEELEPLLESSSSVVEIGAGIGTMLQRLAEWDLLPDRLTYTLVDVDADAIGTVRKRLPAWAREQGYTVASERPIRLERDGQVVTIETVVADATVYLETADPDLLIGAAVLDLFEPGETEALFDRIPDGCHCYFPITFDGGTTFQPTVFPAFDDHVVERYHEDMHRREEPGDPHAGRHLLARAATDHTLRAAGASDWVVCADGAEYPADEGYFLHYIVDTVSRALADDPAVDDDRLETWTERRHEQIERGELVYVAHQLDVLLTV